MTTRMILCSSYRGISQETNRAINECVRRGWASYTQTGSADVALARCIALTAILDKVPDDPSHVVLMVDDDMVFTPQQADALCEIAIATVRPVSGIYSTADGRIAAMQLIPADGNSSDQLYVTGLGFLAIPAPHLHLLAAQSERTWHAGKTLVAFTWSAPADSEERARYKNFGMWISEDYRLVSRLGGARLAKIGIGHQKTVPLYPDEETIERFGQESTY